MGLGRGLELGMGLGRGLEFGYGIRTRVGVGV